MEKKTFQFIYSEWRKAKSRMVKESSLATYSTNAETHLLPVFGSERDITEHMVQRFIDAKTDAGLSPNTVRDLLLLLRMVTVFGFRHGWNDFRGWEVRLPKSDRKPRMAVLTVSEQRRMMTFLTENFSFRNLGLYLCLCTGMRIGEICALQWGDIRSDAKSIKVRRTIERIYTGIGGTRRTQLLLSTPKTQNSCREIPVIGDLTRMLRPFVSISVRDNFLLTNSAKPLEPRQYRRYYKKVLRENGFPDLNFHGLRHTFATRCIESHCDYKTVSSILGHASIATTMNLYVHPDIEQKRKCIDKMLRKVR